MTYVFCALLAPQQSAAQSNSSFDFLSPPYASAYGDVIAGDGHTVNAIDAVLSYDRTGKADVDLIFLTDRFYLTFDLMGLRRTYLLSYLDSFEAYQTELSLNGISAAELSPAELVNCVLKYHTQP